MEFTEVLGRRVPVMSGGGYSEAYFTSGEHGDHEKGVYRFWVAVGEDEFGDWRIIGRSLADLPPGDRFDRMARPDELGRCSAEDQAIYLRMTKTLSSVHYVRPANEREIKRWISTHDGSCDPHGDAKFIQWPITVRGKSYESLPEII